MNIHVDQNVAPVTQPLGRIMFGFWSKVDEKLNDLLEKVLIEEVKGPTAWVSPLVIWPKADNDIRICVNMRCANEAIIQE